MGFGRNNGAAAAGGGSPTEGAMVSNGTYTPTLQGYNSPYTATGTYYKIGDFYTHEIDVTFNNPGGINNNAIDPDRYLFDDVPFLLVGIFGFNNTNTLGESIYSIASRTIIPMVFSLEGVALQFFLKREAVGYRLYLNPDPDNPNRTIREIFDSIPPDASFTLKIKFTTAP